MPIDPQDLMNEAQRRWGNDASKAPLLDELQRRLAPGIKPPLGGSVGMKPDQVSPNPSKIDYTGEEQFGRSVEQGISQVPGQLWQGIKSIPHILAHPIQTSKDIANAEQQQINTLAPTPANTMSPLPDRDVVLGDTPWGDDFGWSNSTATPPTYTPRSLQPQSSRTTQPITSNEILHLGLRGTPGEFTIPEAGETTGQVAGTLGSQALLSEAGDVVGEGLKTPVGRAVTGGIKGAIKGGAQLPHSLAEAWKSGRGGAIGGLIGLGLSHISDQSPYLGGLAGGVIGAGIENAVKGGIEGARAGFMEGKPTIPNPSLFEPSGRTLRLLNTGRGGVGVGGGGTGGRATLPTMSGAYSSRLASRAELPAPEPETVPFKFEVNPGLKARMAYKGPAGATYGASSGVTPSAAYAARKAARSEMPTEAPPTEPFKFETNPNIQKSQSMKYYGPAQPSGGTGGGGGSTVRPSGAYAARKAARAEPPTEAPPLTPFKFEKSTTTASRMKPPSNTPSGSSASSGTGGAGKSPTQSSAYQARKAARNATPEAETETETETPEPETKTKQEGPRPEDTNPTNAKASYLAGIDQGIDRKGGIMGQYFTKNGITKEQIRKMPIAQYNDHIRAVNKATGEKFNIATPARFEMNKEAAIRSMK